MKHYFIKSFLFLAVLSVCFGFASCSDDEDDTPPPFEEGWTVLPYQGRYYSEYFFDPSIWKKGYVITDPRGKTGVFGGLYGMRDIWQEGHQYKVRIRAEYHKAAEGEPAYVNGYVYRVLEVLSDEVVTDYEVKEWPPYWWPDGEAWPPKDWDENYKDYPENWVGFDC